MAGAREDPELRSISAVDAANIPKHSDPFGAIEVEIRGDVLRLLVEYGGGCATHKFSFFWDGDFREANPLVVEAVIIHDDANDSCEAMITEEVFFDLSSIKKAFHSDYSGRSGEVDIKLKPLGKNVVYRF